MWTLLPDQEFTTDIVCDTYKCDFTPRLVTEVRHTNYDVDRYGWSTFRVTPSGIKFTHSTSDIGFLIWDDKIITEDNFHMDVFLKYDMLGSKLANILESYLKCHNRDQKIDQIIHD